MTVIPPINPGGRIGAPRGSAAAPLPGLAAAALAVDQRARGRGQAVARRLALERDLPSAPEPDPGERPAPHLAAPQVRLALLAVGADAVEQEAVGLLDHRTTPGAGACAEPSGGRRTSARRA